MKKQIKSLRYLAVATLLTITFLSNAHNNAPGVSPLASSINYTNTSTTFNYTWNSEPGATKYTLEITCSTTNKCYSWETPLTSVSKPNVSNGTYNLKLTAHYANSSSIVIEDLIIH